MIIREQMIKQRDVRSYIRENGDMLQYFQDNYQPWMKNFGKEIKEKEMSDADIILAINKKTLEVCNNDMESAKKDAEYIIKVFIKTKSLKESIDYLTIMGMSLKQIIKEAGSKELALSELNRLMSELQGTTETEERKAYFKIKSLYTQLVKKMNKEK